ncbi:MAG: glycoside hydrolase family 127 protein, partial [Sedimentisphaerales bacterium]|nr:glycoside hydrolase family 127 protein [Sedimentisphaerales bacterium]
FDYRGVTLLDSRWKDQFLLGRNYYLNESEDNILHGFRKAAGLPAPGQPLGGWCRVNSDMVLGQWLSGMARIYRATGDTEIREKAIRLLKGWEETIEPDGNVHMRNLYAYDKMLCGLIDLYLYADVPTLELLKRSLNWTMHDFTTNRILETPNRTSGSPGEWYTFAENLYRAYELIGDPEIKKFADSYLHHHYWNKFLDTSRPEDADHVHAYSHVNSFSSLAMAYVISGKRDYLDILRNGYDFLQETQCYASGGYGPMERIVAADGTLGRSLEARNATFETVCGTWAGFKMSRYLTTLTGEARYGDWMERLFYNGIGSALPIKDKGKHFYYSDYRVTGGMKVYKVSTYACCAGTYIQCLADYHNIIYYKSGNSLYVNLYIPSEVVWQRPDGDITLRQETRYPETETSSMTLSMAAPSRFSLSFRIPGWSQGVTISVNGKPVQVTCNPGSWACVERLWNPGDTVEIKIPMEPRMVPIDRQHPRRVAVVRGPSVLVMDDWVFEEIPSLPEPKDLASWLVPDERPGIYRIAPQGDKRLEARFRPFYMIGEVTPYRMYHDLDMEPIPVW